MPGPLIGVTITTPDLDGSRAAYSEYLCYRGVRDTVAPDLAMRLGVPEFADHAMAVLYPESGGPRFIRLIEGPADPAPLTTFGWTAVELIVRDLDRLAESLARSPFRVIGPPEILDFDFTEAIRAMQVVGPSGEILYLTEVTGRVPGFDLPEAHTEVGPPFIAVAGVPDLGAWLASARDAAKFESGAPIDARIKALSSALGLATNTRHQLTTISLGDATYLEIDNFPPPSSPRTLQGGLPCGIIAAAIDVSAAPPPSAIGPLRFEWHTSNKKNE